MAENYRLHHPKRRSAGVPAPAGIFGRGRLFSAVVMLSLLAMAYLARPELESTNAPPGFVSEIGSAKLVPGGGLTSRGTLDFSSQNDLATWSDFVFVSASTSRQPTVQYHLGVVNDPRSELVQRIGGQLATQIAKQYTGTPVKFQFALLADEVQRKVYVYDDGWILVTAGMLELAALENEVAASLAQSIESALRARKEITNATPPGSSSSHWMQLAGFDPRGILSVRARLASQTNQPSSQ